MTSWVGLTGGIGSGKSQVAAYFSDLGVHIMDADAINRAIIDDPYHPALQEIVQQFGIEVLNDSGSLDRAYVRELIFRQPEKKQLLENILHPYILHDLQIAQGHIHMVYGMIELPTLKPKSSFLALVDCVLLIQSQQENRIKRIKVRNGFDETTILAIMRNQISDDQRLLIADDVINNDGNLAQLQQQVKRQHQIYLNRFR